MAARSCFRVLATGLLLAASAASGLADETFFCADGSSVTIDSDNRAAMRDHPCVKAWFANDRARRQAQAGDDEGRKGGAKATTVRRHTVQRAAAARDPQSRPGYLAWSRSRTVKVGPYTSKDEASGRTRRSFRLRLGRR